MNGSTPKSAEIISRPPALSFRTAGIEPPTALYVTINDILLVRIWNSVAGLQLAVVTRLLLANGEFQVGTTIVTPTSDRVVQEFQIPLAEGTLLNVLCGSFTAVARRGACFASVSLTREVRTGAFSWAKLINDYATDGMALGWPAGVLHAQVEGAGLLRVITGTDPAAGAEISETVPTNARWRLISMLATLVTDATVINRNPSIALDDGASVFYRNQTTFAHTASNTVAYTFSPNSIQSSVLAGQSSLPLPNDVFLAQGSRIRTITNNLQAGDNWGAPVYLVEEWIED